MPHFVIDYSRDIETDYDISTILQIAFDSGLESGVMQAADLKVRARAFDHHLMEIKGASFLHVTVFLLEGRSDAQKRDVARNLRKNLGDFLTSVTSVSVDIRDMNPNAYDKRLLPAPG